MASTASSTPDAVPCIVCGTETTSYCSACRQAGTVLAFCSKEHQKLVWKHHKLVCGPASNPFKWPQPSAQELAVIKSVAHKRFEQPFPRAGGHTLAEELEGMNGMQGGAWETALIPDYEDLDFHSVPVQGVLITHLRGEFYRAASVSSCGASASQPRVDPPESLLQQWRHRAVVLASLLDSRPSGPSSPDKPHDRAIAHALAAMWQSVAPCVPVDKGTTATELAKKLQTDVAKQVRTNQVITRDADGKPVKSVVTVVRETAVPLFGTTLSFKVE